MNAPHGLCLLWKNIKAALTGPEGRVGSKTRVLLYEVQHSGENMLYVERHPCGKRRRVWAHVEVFFPGDDREALDWDFFLLPGERLPLVPAEKYRGWARARLTLPDHDANYAVETRSYLEASSDTSS